MKVSKSICLWAAGLTALAWMWAGTRAQGAVLVGVDEALRTVFKGADDFQLKRIYLSPSQQEDIGAKAMVDFGSAHSTVVAIYTARKGQEVVGYAFEDTVAGKWGPIHYLTGLDSLGAVVQVVILDYQEIRGRPIAKRRFLRQYERKMAGEPLLLGRDIDGITGATISSRSLTDGIRKILYIFQEIGGGEG